MRYGALPVEYDNSLSYYEQLCGLSKNIKDIKNALNGDIGGLVDDYLNANFDKLVVGAVYNQENETITLGTGETQRGISESYVNNFVIGDEKIWIKDRKTEDVANVVLDFGADKTGVKDSTEAIQKALNSGKPYVYFPNGHYKINDLIKVNSNTYVFGENAIIEQTSVTALGVLINNSDGNVGNWNSQENITLDGLSFSIHTKWGCVAFGHCKNITIKNCKMYNDGEKMQGHHIEINSCFNVLIENCYFTSKKNLNECVQLDVANSSSAFPWFGPYDSTYCKNIKINKCTFYRSSLPDANVLDAELDSAIGNHNGSDDARITNVIVSNNFIRGYKNGIAFRYLVDSKIINNTIESCQVGISTRGDGICYRNVNISDNELTGNINDFKEQINPLQYCRGINIQNPNNVNQCIVIKNNIVRSFAGNGIIVCANNSLITGNYVIGCGQHGMYVGRTSFKTTYTNNVCQGNRKLVDTPDNFFDIYVVQSSANAEAYKGATYVFGNCCEYLGMNILETGISRSFVFGNKYQYVTYPENNNIDFFDNTVTGTGEYQYKLITGQKPTSINTWNLLAETDVANHDSIWIVHGELTIPINQRANITLRLVLGSQEIARQSFNNDGTAQRSVAVTSVGFIKKGSSAKLYLYTDNADMEVGNVRFRVATLPSQTASPEKF